MMPNAGPYTVVGGEILDREFKNLPGFSIVLLNRGARPFRRDLFNELCKLGAREVISLESAPCSYDVESLSRRYDKLRFLIFSEESNTGARINAAFREALSDHVFVFRGDMKISASSISSRVFDKISERKRLCTVPVFRDAAEAVLPTALGPFRGADGRFSVHPASPGRGESPTLIPWDYTGIYRKDKHQALGGFDAAIDQSWWQKVEYGVRAWLWGEQIMIHPALKGSYIEEIPPEDASPGPGYRQFYLKMLAVRLRKDAARLPLTQCWTYQRSSGESYKAVQDDCRRIRLWVKENRFRFIQDAARLTELWKWETE